MASTLIDLAGKRFGKLVVLGIAERRPLGRRKMGTFWACQCDCGGAANVAGESLRSGKTNSCGCARVSAAQLRAHNLMGRRIGRLTVVSVASARPRKWLCLCDCGNTTTIITSILNRGLTRSCGCLRIDEMRDQHTKHGLSFEPEYAVWLTMKQRCHNPKNQQYRLYGARGIRVCDRWFNDFSAFIADMGRRPSDDLSIDRIDNDGDYEPGNCRWTTAAVQVANRRPRALWTSSDARAHG